MPYIYSTKSCFNIGGSQSFKAEWNANNKTTKQQIHTVNFEMTSIKELLRHIPLYNVHAGILRWVCLICSICCVTILLTHIIGDEF